MKLREIILDFTSLLDVIMIILFWFILNYQSETTKIRDQAQAAQQAAAEAQVVAEEQQAKAEQMKQDASNELAMLDAYSHNQASIMQEVFEFGNGHNLNLTLRSTRHSWELTVKCGTDEYLATLDDRDADHVAASLQEILADIGYEPNDVVFCVFAYNSDDAGSSEAYDQITSQLQLIQKVNNRFFYTEIDYRLSEEETT